MDREDFINLSVLVALIALAAAGLWLCMTFTPWLDALSFNPWWIMAPIVVLGFVIAIIMRIAYIDWDDETVLVSLIASVILVGLAAANIGLGIFLKPWLEGLPFNGWWLSILILPFGASTLLFVLYFDRQWELNIDSIVLNSLISASLLLLVAGNLALVVWLPSLFESLAFNPWGLLIPIGLVCAALTLISGWGEFLLYITGIPALLLLTPFLTVTAPVWGTIYAVIVKSTLRPETGEIEEGEAPPKGPWSDIEIHQISEDSFFFRDYASVLADRAEEAKPPLTIGVFGRWGSGKTSLMRLVKIMLEERAFNNPAPLETLWVNVWELSNRPELWTAFVQSLLTMVHAKLPWYRQIEFDLGLLWKRIRWRALLRALLVNSYRVLIVAAPFVLSLLTGESQETQTSQLLAILLDPITGGGASLLLGVWLLLRPVVEAAREKVSLDLNTILVKAPHEEQVSVLQGLQAEFKRLVETWIGKDGRLVVFVDDLDRCAPEKIPEVLEALELFIATGQCVYVLGVDPDIVSEAVKEKNRYSDAGAIEYIEKIVQVPFHLPRLIEESIVNFIGRNYPDVGEDLRVIFARGLERNPRKVKRALNVYRTLLDIIVDRNENWFEDHEPELELVGKMVVIQSRFRELYSELSRDPALVVAVEKWAQLYKTAEMDADPKAKDLHAWVGRYVSEIGIPALAAMLKAGEASFEQIKTGDLGVYVYMTSTIDDPTELYRPRREERVAMLSGDELRIASLVNDIKSRSSDPTEQQEIQQRYSAKLKNVLRKPRRFTLSERYSANLALNILHEIRKHQDIEPEMVWIPAGPFLMGRTEAEINALLDVSIASQYEEVIDLLRKQNGSETWIEFTQTFVANLEKELQDFRQVGESARSTLTPFVSPWGEGGFRDFFAWDAHAAGYLREQIGKHQSRPDLPDYLISRFPITREQYEAFIQSPGHPATFSHASDLPSVWENYYQDSPVIYVSWPDARAYCDWLSQQTGRQYCLPSEAEWEKAARGVSGERFPWGDLVRAGFSRTRNPEDGELGYPSVIGSFYEGNSPYLVSDTIGNVWEWTSSLFEKYPYDPGDGREDPDTPGARVLRGGSYLDALDVLSCSTRHSAPPETRLPNVGFRVVMHLGDILE